MFVADNVKVNSVDILAICEPRVQFHRTRASLLRLGFTDFEIVEAIGFSGGIWLLWNRNKIYVSFIDKNFQSISVKVDISGKPSWMLTVVYASPTHSIRANLWSYFDNLTQRVGLPCTFIEDFNELVSYAD